MTALFVTASGTDVGKTYVTCRLLRALKSAGRSCGALKPVASGFDDLRPAASDTGALLQALDEPITPAAIERVSPWRFGAPISPDMAAAREGRRIVFEDLIDVCRTYAARHELTLIEGIGGVMVPLDERHTVLDWIAALGAPALLVAGSYVGTLSHTLTAAGMLANRDIALRAIVVSESADSAASLPATIETLERFLPETPIFGLARHAPDSASVKLAAHILGAAPKR